MALTLDHWPHPLTAEGRETRAIVVAPGATLADVVERTRPGVDVHASLDGELIPRGLWSRMPVHDRQVVTLRASVGDVGGGDTDPLRTVLQIAVLVAAVYVAGPAGVAALGATGAAVASAGIAIGGSLVVNALVPPPEPEVPGRPGAQGRVEAQYSITGGANPARPYEPMLLVLGRHRVYPDLAAREYTEFRGGEQYLAQVFSFGVGDLDVGDLYSGETLLADYDEVRTEWALPGAAVTIVAGDVDTAAGAALEDTNWVRRRTPARTNRIGVDFVGQVFRVNEETGERQSHSVTVEVRYSEDGMAWTEHPETLRSSSAEQLRRTLSIDLPSAGEWIVEVRRTSAPSSSDRVYDTVTWTALRSYQTGEADRGADTLLAVEIRASGQLSGRVDRLHAVVAQRVPVWTAGAWTAVPEANSNPAAIFRWLARGKYDADGRLIAGAGHDVDDVDDAVLGTWYEWCEAQALECNHVVQGTTDVEELLDLAAQCGRATRSWRTGKLGVVWDASDRAPSAVITPGRIVAGSLVSEWASGPLAEEIVVRYLDPDADWQYVPVRRKMPGVTTPAYTATVTARGVTSRRQAAVIANLQAARQRYHRRRMVWEMGRGAASLGRGDVVYLDHDLVTGGVTGRLRSVAGANAVLDREVDVAAGSSMLFGLPDGSHQQSQVASTTGIQRTDAVTLDDALPADIAGDDGVEVSDVVWRLYRADETPLKVRIVAVEPLSAERFRIAAIDEVDAYHAAATSDLDVDLPAIRTHRPRILDISVSETLIRVGRSFAVQIEAALTVAGDWRGGVVRAHVDDEPDRQVARLAADDTVARWVSPPSGRLVITAVPGSAAAPAGPAVTVEHAIVGLAAPPAPPTNFLIDALGDGTRRFRWAPPADPDVVGYRIRYAEDVVAGWDDMAPLHDGLLTSSPHETNDPPAGTWRFALRSVDVTGQLSTGIVFIVAELPDPRLGERFYWTCPSADGWPGTIEGAVRSQDGRDALEGIGAYTWGDLTTWAAWQSWGLGNGMGAGREMLYTAPAVDLGVKLSFSIGWSADVSGDASLEYRAADTATGLDTEAWATYTPGSLVTGRHAQLRWRLTGDGSVQLSLDHLCWSTLGNAASEQVLDSSTAEWQGSAATGREVPVTGRLSLVTSLAVTLQSVGAGWSWELLLKSPPTIRIHDSDGNAADATVDVLLYGVGA